MELTPQHITRRIIEAVAHLDQRKYRRQSGLFKAEGTKCVLDTIPYFDVGNIYATGKWLDVHRAAAPGAIPASRGEMQGMSSLSTASDVIEVMTIPHYSLPEDAAMNNLIVALDTIQDPGNLGTIIRVADWYGINDIVCSRETADCFAPKVIQSTMGSISRVHLHYCDLPETIARLSERGKIPVYGTYLDGEDIDTISLSRNGVIVIGNEGNGISDAVSSTVTKRITLPSFPQGRPTAESLNAAVATAITVSKFRSSKF